MCAAVTCAWRAVTPLTARRKEPPQPMHGHAAATVGTQMWIAGGRYGRKSLRSFFCFDTGPCRIRLSHRLVPHISYLSRVAEPDMAGATGHVY